MSKRKQTPTAEPTTLAPEAQTLPPTDLADEFSAGVTAAANQVKSAKPKVLRPICQHSKADGTSCTRPVILVPWTEELATYCTDHRPAVLHLTDHERQWVAEQVVVMTVESLVELLGWGRVKVLVKQSVSR